MKKKVLGNDTSPKKGTPKKRKAADNEGDIEGTPTKKKGGRKTKAQIAAEQAADVDDDEEVAVNNGGAVKDEDGLATKLVKKEVQDARDADEDLDEETI